MFVAALFALALEQVGEPLPLDNMPVDVARTLSGKRGRFVLASAKPNWTLGGVTVIGCEDGFDGVERSAVLKGVRTDVEGKEVVVTGAISVIDHPAKWIGPAWVAGWTEIRVEE